MAWRRAAVCLNILSAWDQRRNCLTELEGEQWRGLQRLTVLGTSEERRPIFNMIKPDLMKEDIGLNQEMHVFSKCTRNLIFHGESYVWMTWNGIQFM